MGSAKQFVIIGNDARLRHAAEGFAALGYDVLDTPDGTAPALFRTLASADGVILPIPAFSEGCVTGTALPVPALCAALGPQAVLFGGRLRAGDCPCPAVDYSVLEFFQQANAIPSAEGAIQLMMEQLPITLQNAEVLVIGFGRIGKALAVRLAALGARVTVSARKPADLSAIDALGLRSDVTGHYRHGLGSYDCIVNTAPAPVLPREAIAATRPDCFLLDLASQPGGIDFDACRALGRISRHALSLPGKVAPRTSGLIVRDTILDYLNLRWERC